MDEFKDSCELAKIGLAVWVAKREAFPAFEGWMYSLESGDRWRPRSPEAARAKAIELVGQSKFDTAHADPWIEQFMQTSIRIYGDTVLLDQPSNALPKLVYGSRWVIPAPHDADDLISILHTGLAVPTPSLSGSQSFIWPSRPTNPIFKSFSQSMATSAITRRM